MPFNCPFSPLYTEYQISLPLHVPQLVKSLPFHIPKTWKKVPPFGRSLPVQAIIGSTPRIPSQVCSRYTVTQKRKKRLLSVYQLPGVTHLTKTPHFFPQEALSLEPLVNEHYLEWPLRNFPRKNTYHNFTCNKLSSKSKCIASFVTSSRKRQLRFDFRKRPTKSSYFGWWPYGWFDCNCTNLPSGRKQTMEKTRHCVVTRHTVRSLSSLYVLRCSECAENYMN